MSLEDEDITLENLFRDLNHPNPNINNLAFENMRRFWPEQSIERLIKNLDSTDISLRRISVKGLASFGIDIVSRVIGLYSYSNNEITKMSCLKILTIVASQYDLNNFKDELNNLIESALGKDSPEMILVSISLLRQIGQKSLPFLKLLCRDENLLKAKAAITALIEIKDPSLQLFLLELSRDNKIDILIRENAKDALVI